MTDSTLADRGHAAAVTMWESSGLHGPKPERAAFDHLNVLPDEVPDLTPGSATVPDGQPPVPAPLDTVTSAAVKAVLEEMQASATTRGGTTAHDSGSAA